MKVRDFMSKNVISCHPYTPIQEVAKLMSDKNISALVVVNDDGTLAGVVSQTDLVNIRVHEEYWEQWRGLSAKHIMTREVVTISPDATLEEAAKLMKKHGIHRLVVTETRNHQVYPIGVISMTDIVRAMAKGV